MREKINFSVNKLSDPVFENFKQKNPFFEHFDNLQFGELNLKNHFMLKAFLLNIANDKKKDLNDILGFSYDYMNNSISFIFE